MPDAQAAVYRRGAADTFDRKAFTCALTKVCDEKEKIVAWPGFDHAKGDPVDDEHIFIRGRHKVAIVEGLYVLCWPESKARFDVAIYLDASIDVCMNALKTRNLVIPGYSPEEIQERVDKVDKRNAEAVASAPRDGAHIIKGWSLYKKTNDNK